jgi:hypothetical protein
MPFQGGNTGGVPDSTDASGGGAGTGITSGSNPYTGFASQFKDQSALQNIYGNPWALLPYVYKGMNPYGTGYGALRNLNFDPMTMFALMNGKAQGTSFGKENEGDYANFLNNLYQMIGGTPGTPGRGFSARELAGNVFSAGPGSALGELLASGDASQQGRTLYNLLRDIGGASMNPLAQRAYESMAQRAIDQAYSAKLGGTAGSGPSNMPLAQLVAQIAPQLMAR